MDYKENILELIGNTPLVKINKLAKGLKPQIFAKLESANPGGSVKDRIGYNMIIEAEKNGDIKPGGTIIEATSGNTGIGLALTASFKGYKSLFVCTDKVSQEKINYLRALGAEVVLTSVALEPDHPDYYVNIAKRLEKEIPNSLFIYQYFNENNYLSHYKTTGPEIWEQTDGKITHFVSGVGTGGTISGVGKFLKEKNPDIKIIGSDPVGSIYDHYRLTKQIGKGTPYLIEGIGGDCIHDNIKFEYIDEIRHVNDRQSVDAAQKLTKYEGIFAGGSTGTILHTVLELAKDLTEEDVIIFIVCDTGERYLSKIYNHDWLKEHGLLGTDEIMVKELVERKRASGISELVSVNPSTGVKQVMDIIQEYDYSTLPVIEEGKILGCIKSTHLTYKILDNAETLNLTAGEVMEKTFPVLDINTSINEVKEILKKSTAVLIRENEKVIDLVNRYDMIEFLSDKK